MGVRKGKVAVLLIHGIGVQDRFDFLRSFTDALLTSQHVNAQVEFTSKDTYTATASYKKPNPRRVLRSAVPIEITYSDTFGRTGQKSVDFHECHWGPTMNRGTNFVSVCGFILQFLFRLLPWHRRKGGDMAGHRVSIWRWLYTSAYLIVSLFLVGLACYWAISTLTLATDRGWILSDLDDTNSLSITNTQAYTSLSSKDQNEKDESFNKALLAQKAEQSMDALRDMGGTWNSSLSDSAALLNQEPPQGPPDSNFLVQHVADQAEATVSFLRKSFTYLLTRHELVDKEWVPTWPEPWHAIRCLRLSDLLLGALFTLLTWTLFFGSLATLIKSSKSILVLWIHSLRSASKERSVDKYGEWRSLRRSFFVSSLVLLALGLLSVAASLASTEAYLLALAALVVRVAYGAVNLIVVQTIGDIEIYATRNSNNAKFTIRRAVLDKAKQAIVDLTRSGYDEVIIVAHSLGSVVALEALRSFYDDYLDVADSNCADLSKISTFVTLGSPLVKFSVFFSASPKQAQFDELNVGADRKLFEKQGDSDSLGIRWINYWNKLDIIADPLPTGPATLNIAVGHRPSSVLWTHSDYWFLPKFQATLAEAIVLGKQAGGERSTGLSHEVSVKAAPVETNEDHA